MSENFFVKSFAEIPLVKYSRKELFALSPNDTVSYARKMMLRNNLSKLLVLNEGKIVGIISLRDIAFLLTKLGREIEGNLDQILVKNVAKKDVVKIDENRSVKEASELMVRHKIGSVITTSNEELSGIFTPTDACRVFYDYPINDIRVSDAMNRNFAKISMMASLPKVIEKFEQGIDVVVVEDNKIPVGIITISRIAYLDESEFLVRRQKFIRGNEEYSRIRIGKLASDIMLRIDMAIGEKDKLLKAVNYLLEYDFPAIPVINEYGEVIGIVGKRNIVELIART